MCACAAKLLLHVGFSSYTVLCWLVGVLKRLKLALAISYTGNHCLEIHI